MLGFYVLTLSEMASVPEDSPKVETFNPEINSDWHSMSYINGTYVVATSDTTFEYSTDGATWATNTLPGSDKR